MRNSPSLFFPLLLVFFEMATYLSNDMYLPALPFMTHEFSISYHQAQMVLTTWFFGSISAQLILGPLSDRFGRKSVLCAGTVLFAVSTFFCMMATNIHTLLIARFFQGTGICFISVPGYASIHESFDQKHSIRLLALMGSIAVLAPAFGPLLGSLILAVSNWRWIFGFLLIWSCIASLLLFIWMPETLPPEKRHSLEMKPLLRRYFNIVTNRSFITTIFAFGFVFCGFILWIAAGPFLTIDQFNYTPFMFGLFQALIFIGYISASRLVRYMMEWVGIQKMIRYGFSIALCGSLLALLSSYLFPLSLWGFIIAFVLFAFGSGFIFSPLNRLTIEASDQPMGARMAVFSTFTSSFATLATILVSVFYNGTLLSISILLTIVVLLALFFEKMR